jgi:hypothetical protein
MVRSSTEIRQAVKGGVIAGFIAGATLTVLMTVMSLARHNDVWYGMKGAAAPFLGARAMHPGLDVPAVLLGLACHLAVSIAWAVPFALAIAGLGRLATVVGGAAWGIVVWLGMFYVVLPLVGLPQMANEAPIGRTIVYHLFFGIAVGAAFAGFQHHFVRGQKRPVGRGPGRLIPHRVRGSRYHR